VTHVQEVNTGNVCVRAGREGMGIWRGPVGLRRATVGERRLGERSRGGRKGERGGREELAPVQLF